MIIHRILVVHSICCTNKKEKISECPSRKTSIFLQVIQQLGWSFQDQQKLRKKRRKQNLKKKKMSKKVILQCHMLSLSRKEPRLIKRTSKNTKEEKQICLFQKFKRAKQSKAKSKRKNQKPKDWALNLRKPKLYQCHRGPRSPLVKTTHRKWVHPTTKVRFRAHSLAKWRYLWAPCPAFIIWE